MTANSTRQHESRRDFLKNGLAATAAFAAGGNPLRAATPATISPLHAPFTRMRLSLAAYSLREFMPQNWPTPRPGKNPPSMTMMDFVDYCAKLDLDGCELTSYFFPAEITDEYLARLKVQALWNRMQISGTAIGNNFCVPDGEERDRQLAMTRQWIDYAAVMGAPVIRIFAGQVAKGDTEAVAIERCVAGINQSLDYAATKGVSLALENHGGITATPEQMLRIVRGVKPSPFFGVNFDSGNFRTDDPYHDLEQIAPYTINAQIKVAITRNGKKEEADLPRTIAILRNAGYVGWVVLEYEEQDPKQEIPRYIEQLRKLIA